MKNNGSVCFKVRFFSTLSRLLIGPGLLLGLLSGLDRAGGQIFPPQGDDTFSSMGVFRIVVNPPFRSLMAPDVGLNGYPGYRSSDGRLTSPVLIDNNTDVARSDRYQRPLVGTVPVGLPPLPNIGYGDYPSIPFLFFAAPPPTEEILTQIRSFRLETTTDRQCTNDGRVPSVPITWPMVKAGPDQGVLNRSVGMVQENVANGNANPDFPARSFFDIFVEVNLPAVPLTVSAGRFPATGAVLTNDPFSPLVITNLNLSSLPPHVIYIHGETPAVPLKFRDNNPPNWFAGDVFGYVVLAGHGTLTNDCASEAALLDQVLGPIGTSKPELAIPLPFGTNLCPSPATTYDSVKDVDVIRFTIPGAGTLRARNFVHGNLLDPISPPPNTNTSTTYGYSNTLITTEFSLDNQNWFSAQAGGPVRVSIAHVFDRGNTAFFDTEMLQLNLSGVSPFGPFMVRESPTRASTGKHTIQKYDPQGFLITSFFDVNLELSTDNGLSWIPADRAIRVQVDHGPCGALGARLNAQRKGDELTLAWSDKSYSVQCRPIAGSSKDWVDVTGPSPITLTIAPVNQFYRLVCR